MVKGSNSARTHEARKPSHSGWIVIGLILFALLAAALLYATFWKNTAQREAETIANSCAGGHQLTNKSEITAGLTDYLTKASSKAEVSSNDVGVVTGMLRPDQIGLQFYETYTKCLREETNDYLRLKGVDVKSGPAAIPETSTASVPEVTPLPKPNAARGGAGGVNIKERESLNARMPTQPSTGAAVSAREILQPSIKTEPESTTIDTVPIKVITGQNAHVGKDRCEGQSFIVVFENLKYPHALTKRGERIVRECSAGITRVGVPVHFNTREAGGAAMEAAGDCAAANGGVNEGVLPAMHDCESPLRPSTLVAPALSMERK